MKTHPDYLRAVWASFLIALVFWQLSSTWGLQIIQRGGHKESIFGALMALNGFMVVLMELPLTSGTRRRPAVKVMMTGYALVGVGMGMNIFGTSIAALVVVMIVVAMGEMIALPVAQSYIAGLAPEEMRGRFMGMLGVAWNGATMLGPALGIALFKLSPNSVWIGCLFCGLGAAWLIRPRKFAELFVR
ncbi:MAG: MFS transporter [Akkermansiaceae bacterium]|jgi:predicted MFS family arabinose efflux permease